MKKTNRQNSLLGFISGIKWRRPLMIIMIILFTQIVMIFVRSINREAEDRAIQYSRNSTVQLKQNLDYHMKSIATMADSALFGIYDYVSSTQHTLSEEYDEFKAVNNLLYITVNQEIISDYRLYVPDEKMYSRQKDRFYPIALLKDEIAQQLREVGESLWISGHRQARYYTLNTEDTQHVFSYITSMHSMTNFDTLQAVLYIDIPEEAICDLLDDAEDDSQLFVIQKDGTILSAKDKTMLDQNISSKFDLKLLNSQSGQTFASVDGLNQLITWDTIDSAPWSIIRLMPYRSATYMGSFRNTILLIAILLLTALAIMIMFSYVLDSVIKRIGQIVANLREHGLGVLEHAESKTGSLDAIEKNVDDLTLTIRSLVEENYKARLTSRNAELKALQAQINPHFLYNTLDSIKWLIMDHKDDASIAMVNDLSRYFRKSLNRGRDIVPLRDEYELIASYLTIQAQRFPNDFQVIWDIDQSVMDTLLPKLTLQPIVENALLHGAQTCPDGAGKIWISFSKEGKNAVIVIRDNGQGMEPEAIRQALERDVNARGYGISNVIQRLRLFGGDLQIESDLDKGTTARVIIPLTVSEA